MKNLSVYNQEYQQDICCDDWSIKASYSEMQQNIHLLSNSSVGLPSDLWVPAIDSVPSQKSKQWASGIATELFGGTYEFSLEGYFKTMNNLITYKEGYSNLNSNESWENAVETGGEGRSYGGELFLQKKKVKLQDGLDILSHGQIVDLII